MMQNTLDLALQRAATDPASRPDFYRVLLDSEIFVIGNTDSQITGRSLIPAGAKISIAHWEKSDGTPVTPFFTSLEALQRNLKEESSFLALPARSFFEFVKGQTLILNPGSSYGKEFFPNEVTALLSSGVNHLPTQRTVQEETQVLLGQPANYPTQMVAALKAFLPRHANVQAAYLCLMQESGSESTPSLVVGFEGTGDISQAMREAGSVAADTADTGNPVDFVEIKAGEAGVGSYMQASVEPFYRRKDHEHDQIIQKAAAEKSLDISAAGVGVLIRRHLFSSLSGKLALAGAAIQVPMVVLLAAKAYAEFPDAISETFAGHAFLHLGVSAGVFCCWLYYGVYLKFANNTLQNMLIVLLASMPFFATFSILQGH
jgi:hypothetical protein